MEAGRADTEEPEVELVHQLHDVRKGKGIGADYEFQACVDSQGAADSVGQQAEEPTPERQPQHERRQDGAGRQHGIAENRAERAHPCDFVNESGRPRDEKQRQDQLADDPDSRLHDRVHGCSPGFPPGALSGGLFCL